MPWYCECFLGLGLLFGASPDADLKVVFDPKDGRAPASAVASLHLDREHWHPLRFWGCGWLLIVLALLAYAFYVIRNLVFADRFPREARFYIFEIGRSEPVGRHVRSSIWSDIRTAFMKRPRHSYRLDGLIVEAIPGGLQMRTASAEWPNYEYRRRANKTLQEVAEEMTKRGLAPRPADAIIQAHWDDVIQQPMDDGRRIVFVKNYVRRPQAAMTRDIFA
jgi:hypothetical protein